MATLSFLRGTVAEAYPITQAIEVADASTGLKIFGGILLYLCSSISSAGGVGESIQQSWSPFSSSMSLYALNSLVTACQL